VKKTFKTNLSFQEGDYEVTYTATSGRAATRLEPEEHGELEIIKVVTDGEAFARNVTDMFYNHGWDDLLIEQIEESGDPSDQWAEEDQARGEYLRDMAQDR